MKYANIKVSKNCKKMENNSKSNYILHTSGAGFSPLMFDFILQKDAYGAVDYRILYEDNISYWYLTKKGNKQAERIGRKMFDDKSYCIITKDFQKMNNFLTNYPSPKFNEKNILNEFFKYVGFARKFLHLYRYFEQPFTQSLEKFVNKNLNEEEVFNYLSTMNDKARAKLIIDDKTKKVLKRLFEIGEMKLALHKSAEKFYGHEWPKMIDYISNKRKISTCIIEKLRINEVKKLILNKNINVKDLEKRSGGCLIYRKGAEVCFLYGKKYINFKNKITSQQNRNIIGKTAYKGTARGKVVLHMIWVGTTNINEGDILVTGMTNPQMLPYIKKAGAIVTDEGGICCHAAIIARELKKPCIIGTKIATQVLKDGDFVEVDANKGIVKIIKQ